MREKFTWGRVIEDHVLGPYTVREYHPRIVDGITVTKKIDETEIRFHGYIDGKDTNESWPSLEDAIVGLIVKRIAGLNCSAINYCFMQGVRAYGSKRENPIAKAADNG